MAAVNSNFFPVSPAVVALRNADGEFLGAIEQADLSKLTDDIQRNLLERGELLRTLRKRFSEARRPFMLAARQLLSIPAGTPSAAAAFDKFNGHYYSCSALTWTAITIYPLAIERVAASELVKAGFAPEDAGRFLSIAGASNRPSFSRKAELHLLSLALQFSEDANISDSMPRVRQNLVEWLHGASPSKHALAVNFARQFGWVPYDYTGPAWIVDDVVARLRDLLSDSKSVFEKCEEAASHSRRLARERAQIRHRLRRHVSAASAVDLLSNVSFIQDWRKEVFTYGHYCVSAFLEKVGTSLALEDWRDLRYLTAEDLSRVLSGAAPDISAARQRRHFWSAICTKGCAFTVDSSENARRFAPPMQDSAKGSTRVLTGTPASQGHAVGSVRVIRDEAAVSELLSGEILVAKMTTPAFEVALSKAAAVITDEGGLTSHAATRSRERGLPCIVGTQRGTDMLRTGDFVEVDATNGLVWKLDPNDLPTPLSTALQSPTPPWNQRDKISKIHSWANRKRFVVSLSDEDAKLPHLAGGKAAASARLLGRVRMPPGFCITTAAFVEFLAVNKIDLALTALATRLAQHPEPDSQSYCDQAIKLITENPIPTEIRDAVSRAYRQLSGPVAVRSSSTAEDATVSSAAGIFESVLNVSGESSLFDAIRRCWASLYSRRAVTFRQQYGIPETDAMMAVLVQRLVEPCYSGVLFTAHPVTGSRKEMLIEVVQGMGESLVSGQVTPDRYVWSRRFKKLLAYEKGSQRFALVSNPAGGLQSVPVSAEDHDLRLRDSLVAELVRVAELVEEYFGSPQDIEWAVADHLYILQSRPITTI